MNIHGAEITDQRLEAVVGPNFTGAETFYRAAGLPVTEEDTLHLVAFPRADITEEAYERNLADVRDTLRVLPDPKSNFTVEVANSNLSAPAGPQDAEFSTYGSAISSNDGNGAEFAENAAIHPDRPRLYVASFGNGYTSPLSSDEAKYVRQSGSFIYQEYEGNRLVSKAIPTVRALHRALQHGGIELGRLSANSAGGNIATALAHEMPEGQISHVYLKGRPNVVSHVPLALGVRMMVLEHFQAAKNNKSTSLDPWSLTPEMVEHAAEVFGDKDARLQDNAIKSEGIGKVVRQLGDGRGYSRGIIIEGSNLSPAAFDTALARQKQPDAHWTFHFSSKDQLYRGRYDDLARFTFQVAQAGDPQKVSGLIVPGTHADHTYMPSLRWSAERHAFDK